MQKYFFIIFFFFSYFIVFSQENLSLQEAISKTVENNNSININRLDSKISETDLQKTKTAFLPQVQLSYTGISTNDALNVFGFKMQQNVVEINDFNPDLLNNPNNIYNFNTKISVKQPILNFDVFEMQKAVKTKIEATQLQGKRIEEALSLEVKKAYADLQFLYEAEKVSQKAKIAYEENLRVAKNILAQGMMKKSDVLSIEIEIKNIKNQIITINNNIKNLSDFLSYMMNEPLGKTYKPTENLEEKLSIISDNSIDNRTDFQAMQKGISAREFMMKAEDKKFLPRINAFGEFNLNDENPIGFGANSYMIGVQLSWDVFNGNSSKYEKQKIQAEIDKAEAELNDAKNKTKLEIAKSKRDNESSQLKIELAKAALNQAEEAHKIITDRYNQGLEKTSDVLASEAKVLEKKLQILEAIKEYNKTIYQLEFLTIQS